MIIKNPKIKPIIKVGIKNSCHSKTEKETLSKMSHAQIKDRIGNSNRAGQTKETRVMIRGRIRLGEEEVRESSEAIEEGEGKESRISTSLRTMKGPDVSIKKMGQTKSIRGEIPTMIIKRGENIREKREVKGNTIRERLIEKTLEMREEQIERVGTF